MAAVPRTFTDNDGRMSFRNMTSTRVEASLGGVGVGVQVPAKATIVERWAAIATACEARPMYRDFGRRIRYMLGTAAGIDAP